MKTLNKIAIIPALHEDKELVNKNVLLLENTPLLEYTIQAAIESQQFSQIILVSNSEEYFQILRQEYKITHHLIINNSSLDQTITSILSQFESKIDYFTILQPTSPLRNSEHIIEAINLFEAKYHDFDFLCSVTKSGLSSDAINPLCKNGSLANFKVNHNTNKNSESYYDNGAIFCAKVTPYLHKNPIYSNKTIAYVMDKISSLAVRDEQDLVLLEALAIKKSLLINEDNIKKQIQDLEDNFKQIKPITLIGHSIMYQWKIDNLQGKEVNNLGIYGVKADQYLQFVIKQKLIKQIGEKVILMIGINDLLDPSITMAILCNRIQQLVDYFYQLNPATQVYFIEMTPLALRVAPTNQKVQQFNNYFRQHFTRVKYIELYSLMLDKYGKLNLNYSEDGLHFNSLGYQILQNSVIEKINHPD